MFNKKLKREIKDLKSEVEQLRKEKVKLYAFRERNYELEKLNNKLEKEIISQKNTIREQTEADIVLNCLKVLKKIVIEEKPKEHTTLELNEIARLERMAALQQSNSNHPLMGAIGSIIR